MDKLKQAEKLNTEIDELEAFLPIAEQGGAYSEKYKNQNTFSRLYIEANIWTGRDNPRYEKYLRSQEVIKDLMDMCVPLIKAKIAQKKAELENMFV